MIDIVAEETKRYEVGVSMWQEDWWEEGVTEWQTAGYDTGQ